MKQVKGNVIKLASGKLYELSDQCNIKIFVMVHIENNGSYVITYNILIILF